MAAPTSAERELSIDDAVGALVRLRRFGEHLAQDLAAELGVYRARDVDQVEPLQALGRKDIDEPGDQILHQHLQRLSPAVSRSRQTHRFIQPHPPGESNRVVGLP